jgi:hypothetical protein
MTFKEFLIRARQDIAECLFGKNAKLFHHIKLVE